MFLVAASTLTAVFLVASLLIAPGAVLAGDPQAIGTVGQRPAVSGSVRGERPQIEAEARANAGRPSVPASTERAPVARTIVLDETDQFAALESIQFALTEVGDGASYIWHRNNGRLSGMVQPTSSFKAASGEVCRHVHVMLTSGTRSKKTEGIACRLPSGQWRLEG